MARFGLGVTNTALSTTNDTLTIISASARRLKIYAIRLAGMGATSAAAAALTVHVMRSTGGTTPGGSVTPAELEADGGAAVFTNATTWAAQPTPSDVVLRLGLQAYGGIHPWVARKDEEIILRNAEQISIRSSVGTASVTLNVELEEI